MMLKFCLIIGLSTCMVMGFPSSVDDVDDEYEDEEAVCLTSGMFFSLTADQFGS